MTDPDDGGGTGHLRDRLTRALPMAMKARDRVAVAALRSALAAIANAEAVDPSQAPPQPSHPPPARPVPDPGGSGPGPPGSGARQPDPGGSGPDPPFAGTVAGLGATEVERRTLTGAKVEEIVRAEIADREAVAASYERAGQLDQAERLRREAEVLASYLEQP
jgi:uncharacterized protein